MTDKRKEHYKKVTDEIFLLYQTFQESGFTEEQAFELASTYVRQTIFDNVMRAERDEMRRRSEIRDIKARTDKFRYDMANAPIKCDPDKETESRSVQQIINDLNNEQKEKQNVKD